MRQIQLTYFLLGWCGVACAAPQSPIDQRASQPAKTSLPTPARSARLPDRESARECAKQDAADCRVQCDRGSAISCRYLGYALLDGTGVDRDEVEAARVLYRACAANDGEGCAQLGYVLAEGTSIGRNLKKSAVYYEKSCALGYASGCTGIGFAYSRGEGVERDRDRAASLYERACVLGDGAGCFNVGQLELEQADDDRKPGRAAESFRRGCDLDDASACTQLAFLLAEGPTGVAKDVSEAGRLFQRACRAGEKVACANLEVLERRASGHDRAADRARAEKALPGLFAACMTNRTKLEALRVAGVQAARRGDRAAADGAVEQLKALEPEWASTLDQIAVIIDDVAVTAGGERDAPRYAELMARFQRCSCEPTPSGRCRR